MRRRSPESFPLSYLGCNRVGPSDSLLRAVRNQHTRIDFPSGACTLRGLDTKPKQLIIRVRGAARTLRLAVLNEITPFSFGLVQPGVARDKSWRSSYDGKLWPSL